MGLLGQIWKSRALIAEGLRNKYFPPEDLKNLIKDTVNERKEICYGCPLMSENAKILFSYNTARLDKHCTKCGCNIELKTSSLHSHCPDNPPRWDAVTTEDESNQIQQTLKDEEQESNNQEYQSRGSIEGSQEL